MAVIKAVSSKAGIGHAIDFLRGQKGKIKYIDNISPL